MIVLWLLSGEVKGENMAKSQIIIDVVEGNVSLTQSLNRLLVLSKDINNKKLEEWTIKELNGYSPGDEIPDYRKNEAYELTYSGFNGTYQVKKAPLDKNWIDGNYLKKISPIILHEGIEYVERMAKKDKEFCRDLTMLSGNVAQNTDEEIRCVSISQWFSSYSYQRICDYVKQKIIDIMCKLEKEYGNLDGLGIDVTRKKQKEINELNSVINNTILNVYESGDEPKKEKLISKIRWKIIIPIIIGIIVGVAVAVILKVVGI